MANTKWAALDTQGLWPSSVADIPSVLKTITDSVDAALDAVATAAAGVDAAVGALQDPQVAVIRQTIATVRAALEQMSVRQSTAGIHYLNVPIVKTGDNAVTPIIPLDSTDVHLDFPQCVGSGGNLGFYNTVQKSMYDAGDPSKPNYNSEAAVAALVVMVGSDRFTGIIDALQFLSKLTGMLSTGMDANLLPHPQDVAVRLIPYPNSPKLAAHVTWSPALLVGKPDYGIAGYWIRRAVVYRHTRPVTRDTPQAELAKYEIARVSYNPLALSYVDSNVVEGQTYYYTIGYDLDVLDGSGVHSAIPNTTLSSAHRVTVAMPTSSGTTVYVPEVRGTPPDWRALVGVMECFPKVQLLLNALSSYIASIENGVARVETNLARLASTLKQVVAQRAAIIARIIQTLDEVKALILPVEGVYAFSCAGVGGNAYFLRTLYTALSDRSDPRRPPFDTGLELTAGFVLLAGAGDRSSLAAIEQVLSWLAKGTGPSAAASVPPSAMYLDNTGQPLIVGGLPADKKYPLCDTNVF